MLKKILYWAVFLAVVAQIVALVVAGQSYMPGRPF